MKKKLIAAAGVIAALVVAFFIFMVPPPADPTSPDPAPKEQPPRIEFLSTETIEIERDYNQDRLIAIKNHGPGMAELRLAAKPKAEDLLAGFVGRGTTEWHETGTRVGIPEGETWQLPLLLHADRTTSELYEVDLKATLPDDTAAEHTVRIKVNRPKLQVSTRWEEPTNELDKARLARCLIIKNEGNTAISDLSVNFEHNKESVDEKLLWSTNIEEYQLASNGSVRVKISPRLYPAFTGLTGNIVISGINQKHIVPFEAKLPTGKKVFVTLSRTTRSASGSGKRCTNRPSVSYPVSPTEGTGGEWTPYSPGGGSGGGGRLTPTPVDPTPPTDPDKKGDEEEEDEDDGGFDWRPNGVDDEDSDSESGNDNKDDEDMTPEEREEAKKEREKKRKEEEEKDSKDDDSTFDHLDDNSEGIRGGFIPASSNGTVNQPLGRSIPKDFFDNAEKEMVIKADRIDLAALEKLTKENKKGKRLALKKESSTFVDDKGRKTHMTRRQRKDGTEFLNFGFGIQKGIRKKVPMRIPGFIGQPTMGPRPGGQGGAVTAFTREEKGKGQVIDVVDPLTGQKTTLGNGKADSPKLVKNGNNTDAFFRENGELKRVSLAPDLKVAPSKLWPNDKVKLGPLLNAKVAPDGTPHVISRERDGVAVHTPKGKTLHKATSADLAFLKNGKAITTLRQPDGALKAVMPDGVNIPLVKAHPGNSAPTLTKTADGNMRMFFSRDLPDDEDIPTKGLEAGGNFSMDFKNGMWTKPRRQLMPNAEVEEAAVITSFDLPYGHAHYKPMNTKVLVNGKQVGEMKEKIPAGRYIFPVNPKDLKFANRNSKAKNNIHIKAKGIGPGNFHFSDHVGLYTRHKLCQDCLVADTPEKAEELANMSDSTVRHRSPDLIVASNGYQLPKDAAPGQEIDVKLSLFNAGDRPSKAGKLQAFINNRMVGESNYKGVTPFRGKNIPMKVKLPVDWKKGSSLKMSVRAPHSGDADPSNNDLDFYILKAPNKRIVERAKPLHIDPAKLNQSLITALTAGTKEKPNKVKLKSGTHWYKIEPGKGLLQVEVLGNAARDLHRMYLFDAEGNQVKSQPVKGPFYLQVHAPKSNNDDTTINFWWE